MTKIPLETYDPEDPVNIAAERFRLQITDIAIRALDEDPYRQLGPAGQVASLIGGGITGLIGAAFAIVPPEAHDRIIKYITKSAVPFARKQAEAILQEGKSPHAPHP